MQNLKYHIGLLPADTESLFLAKKLPLKTKISFLTLKNHREEKWIKKFIPRSQIKLYSLKNNKINFADLNTEECFKYSNLKKILRKYKINTIITTDDLERWGKKNKIRLISNNHQLKKTFENKIWFDRFLSQHHLPKPPSLIYQYPQTKITIPGPKVLQEAKSAGGEGTYYIKDIKDIRQLIKNKQLKPKEKYLIRKFIPGKSCGITLIITPNLIALSAVRQMCFINQSISHRQIFQGVQWLPTSFLPKKINNNINLLFTRLGQILQRKKIYGHINFDFIIDHQGQIYLIECNPRFSASTIHLIQFPETISPAGVSQG